MASPNEADYVMELMHNTQLKMEVVHAAIQLGIFMVLDNSKTGLSSENISKKISAPKKDHTERFLNYLVCIKLLEKSKDQKTGDSYVYKNTTQTSKYLTSGPGSLVAVPVWIGTLMDKGVQRLVYGLLDKPMDKGTKADESIPTLFGDGDASLDKNSIAADHFHSLMDCIAYPSTGFLRRLDLSRYTSAVDLGGSSGLWAGELAKMYPKMNVKVVDREGVLASLQSRANKLGHGQYITFEGGDFFKEGLPKADIYLLGHIIHDWTDDQALLILRNVYQALPEGGQIILMEKVLNDEKTGPLPAVKADIVLMCHGGKERNFQEYSSLLGSCSFVNIYFIENAGYNCYDFVIADKK